MMEETVVRHHVLITGTGRTGTTLLMQILINLGLDTGFKEGEYHIDPISHGGLERDIDDVPHAYILKKPHFCDTLDSIALRTDVKIDHVIVPMTGLFRAAESRRANVRKAGPGAIPQNVTGGLFDTADGEKQEEVLIEKIYKLMLAIAKHDIPHTLLFWPRLREEPEYLFEKIRFLLPGIGLDRFLAAFGAVFRPELVHDY
jgi:hypothetical protein